MSLFDSFGQFGWLFLLAVLVIIVLIKTAVVVPNQSAYVVERLGKFHKVLYAGFHLLLPFVDVTAYKRSLKEQVLDVPKQTCITRDNVSVDIDGVLYLQVITPEKSAYGISDYEWGAIQLARLRCARSSASWNWTKPLRNAPASTRKWWKPWTRPPRPGA